MGQFENYTGPDSTLAVYGNSNIHLKNFQPTDYVTAPSISGPTSGDVGVSYEFSAHAIDSHGHRIRYVFDWDDGSPYTETGYNSNGMSVSVNHTWNSEGTFSVRVKAQCESGVWSSWSSSININLENVHWLTVDAVDYFGYPVSSNIYIDGQYAGTGYASVQVPEGWHSVLVDDPAWSDLWGSWAYLYYFTDYYGNGEYRPVYSDTWITAVYYL